MNLDKGPAIHIKLKLGFVAGGHVRVLEVGDLAVFLVFGKKKFCKISFSMKTFKNKTQNYRSAPA